MNTPRSPREILLARHAAARPALDAQHTALLARFAAATTSPAAPFSPLAFLATLHRELIAPCRRTWATLACVWIGLLAFQQLDHLAAPSEADLPQSRIDSTLLAVWLAQRRDLADLGAQPARPTLPAPPLPTPPTRPLGACTSATTPLCLA